MEFGFFGIPSVFAVKAFGDMHKRIVCFFMSIDICF